MKKLYLIAIGLVVVLLILIGVGYMYSQSKKGGVEVVTKTANEKVLPSTSTNPVEIIAATSSGEALPSVSTNPLDNKPNVNPIDQTNPYKNIKTNPFE